ncbi:endonuclease/exonuclease/phosphatase family protein [Gordonia sp. CPCC 205333]|uniref:endonuclease/exonuclease/phosphatase family protein n=1 Tax=Gordonia sp. CPCC 205333 TaxID=3140790 RepID=UPI003AF4072D
MRKVLRLAAIICGWTLVVAMLVAIWLHYYPSRGDLTLYLTSAVPFMLLFGVVAIVLFCSTRVWLALIPTVAVIGGLLWTQLPLWRAQTAPNGPEFTVASANLLFGQADVGDVLEQVRSRRIDLLSVQEMTPAALQRLRSGGIEKDLPYSYVVTGPVAAGTGIFSRHPLSEMRKIDTMVLGNLIARVELPGIGSTWFAAVHPVAPLRGVTPTWNFELGELANVLHALPGPRAIAAGDFNSTWDHVGFRDIVSAGYSDATDQAGAGLLFTYPTDRLGGRPLVAIDHVISRGFVADDIMSFDIEGSDHRGVVATLGRS